MFALVARVAQRCVGEFKAQNLANAVWTFATADQSDAPLFALVARAAQLRVAELKAQGLANAAWAFAKMGLSETPVLPVIMARAAQALSGFRYE